MAKKARGGAKKKWDNRTLLRISTVIDVAKKAKKSTGITGVM
jgi:hypothetical protein